MKNYLPYIITGITMVITGLIYNFSFEYIEEEARILGIIAIILGIFSVLLSKFFLNKYTKYFAVLLYFSIALVQVIPILARFEGTKVSDITLDTPGYYGGNVFYSIPHILLALFCIWCIYTILKRKK